jgi:predicted nuclease with TOPRIM domain
MEKILARTPLDYYPTDKNNTFVDNVQDISASIFKEIGVICPCSNKTYYNKYTFIHQHCKTKTHQDYLLSLKQKYPDILKINEERKKEIKDLRARLVRSENKISQMPGQIQHAEKLDEENNELKIELLSLEEHLKSVISDFESYQKLTVMRNNKTEDFAKFILMSYGYEIE